MENKEVILISGRVIDAPIEKNIFCSRLNYKILSIPELGCLFAVILLPK